MAPSKKEVYTWIKIAGLLSYIPVVLVAGPLAGYFCGELLAKKFVLTPLIVIVLIGLGIIVSIIEAIRIIKLTLKISKKA
jgi:hypothetical protein